MGINEFSVSLHGARPGIVFMVGFQDVRSTVNTLAMVLIAIAIGVCCGLQSVIH